jgi:hypothetical protein
MKENSPTCARLAEIVRAVATGSECQHDQEGRNGLAENNDEQRRCYRPRLTDDGRRIEQHAD